MSKAIAQMVLGVFLSVSFTGFLGVTVKLLVDYVFAPMSGRSVMLTAIIFPAFIPLLLALVGNVYVRLFQTFRIISS